MKTSILKSISAYCFSMLVFSGVHSQTIVSGSLKSNDEAIVSFANVLLLQLPDSTLIKGAVSTENGDFAFEKITAGDYCVVASMLGFHKIYSLPFTIAGESIFKLGTLVLPVESQQLQAVTVSAFKPMFEQQSDRLVINIQNSITTSGGMALDVLDQAPGVSLDRQEGKLSLNGKASVLVMFNGKLNRMPIEALLQQLAGLPTSSIEKIELITNPSAKYDAEGDAGLINIILKKNYTEGLNGTYNLSVGYGFFEKTAAGGMMNYRSGKLAMYGDYSYSNDHMWQQWQFDWKLLQSNTQTNTLAIRRAVMPIHTMRGGIEYNLTPRWQVAGMFSGFDSRWAMKAQSEVRFRYGAEEVHGKVLTNEVNHWQHWMGNLNVRYRTEKTEISLDFDRLYYQNTQPTTYDNAYQPADNQETSLPDRLNIDKQTPFNMKIMKADLVHSITRDWKVESGVKGSFLALQNKVTTDRFVQNNWENDSAFSQKTSMQENILAGYVNLKGLLPGKWQIQGGLRAEVTRTLLLSNEKTRLVDRQYFNLFPSIFLTHELSGQSSFQLSYSRRITRPPYKVLAPTMIFIGPTTLRTGNPGILPTMSNAGQLNYRFKESYLLSVRYSIDRNQFFDYQPQIDRTDPKVTRQIFNTLNIDRSQSLTSTFSFPWSPTKWWQTQTQFLGVWQYSSTRYENNTLTFKQLFGQVNMTNIFRLWPKASAELTAFYNTPSQTMGIFRRQAYGSVTVGLQQKIDRHGGILRLSMSDLFWTNKRIGHYKVPALDIQSYTGVVYEPRVLKLSYSCNFGNQSIKASSRRKTGSEEEQNRAN